MPGRSATAAREFAEVIETEGAGAAERAEFHFVIIAGVEERDGAAFVEPLLQLAWRELRGAGRWAGSMPATPKAMISFLIFTSIRLNG